MPENSQGLFDPLTCFEPYQKGSDYIDVKAVEGHASLRAFVASMLSYYPWWIKLLYRIRQVVVRMLGLGKQVIPDDVFIVRPEDVAFSPGRRTAFFIVCEAAEDHYWIAETPDDKHLKAHFGVVVEDLGKERKRFHVVTMVHLQHWTGYVYFNLIRPFHHLVVSRMARAGITL